jgi:GntR family transcriptional regulator
VAGNRTLRSRPLLADLVRVQLREAISDGEFPVGSKLPNEEDLRLRFGVSRITLREAVRGLIEDGHVVRRQGSGTYVTQRPSLLNSLDTNFSYTEYLENSGRRASKRILDAVLVPADQATAEAMELEPGDPVVRVRRVRIADGRPAIYSIDSMPADVVDAERDRPEFERSLYRLLAERNRPIEHGEAAVLPVLADQELAGILEVPVGEPLLHIRQTDFDQHGTPVLASLEWHVPSVIEVRVYRRGPGPLPESAA